MLSNAISLVFRFFGVVISVCIELNIYKLIFIRNLDFISSACYGHTGVCIILCLCVYNYVWMLVKNVVHTLLHDPNEPFA